MIFQNEYRNHRKKRKSVGLALPLVNRCDAGFQADCKDVWF